MREINAAYDVFEEAPLQHREIPVEPTHSLTRPSELADATRDRPGQVPLRRLGGRSAGVWLGFRELGQDPWYPVLVAIAMGIVFTKTS